jgi:short-subunit dehydrogenase
LKRVSAKCNEILNENGFSEYNCSYFVADLTDKNQAVLLNTAVRNKLGGVDILVLNAGISMDLALVIFVTQMYS